MGFSQPPLWQLCVLEYQTGKGSVSVRAFCASQSIFWSTKCNDKPLCLVIGPISWCPIFLYEEMETGDLISSLAEEYLGKKKNPGLHQVSSRIPGTVTANSEETCQAGHDCFAASPSKDSLIPDDHSGISSGTEHSAYKPAPLWGC